MITKHHNYEFDAVAPNGVPDAAGDRYFSQDLFRDFTYLMDRLGLAFKDNVDRVPCNLSLSEVTQGVGATLNIVLGHGYVKKSVQTVLSYGVTPPSTQDEDIEAIRVAWTTQTNLVPTGYTVGGAVNYVKVAYIELDGTTRARAKKAGSYSYEQSPSYVFSVNTTPPTDYELCIMTFIEAAGVFTFAEYDAHKLGQNIKVQWTSAQQLGNDLNIPGITYVALCALNGTDIAYIDDNNEDLRTYRFDGINWIQVGNDLNIVGIADVALCALNGTDVAYIDAPNDDLRVYRFDGTNWTQVGNDLNIAGLTAMSITAMNETDIAFIDDGNEDLRLYRFDGTDWTQVGNDLNIAGIANSRITAINETDVAYIDGTNDELRTYRFDGTDWTQVGNSLAFPSGGFFSISSINETDIAMVEASTIGLGIYRFDGTDWVQVGSDVIIATMGKGTLASLNGTDVAFIDITNEDLRMYRFGFSLMDSYHLSWL